MATKENPWKSLHNSRSLKTLEDCEKYYRSLKWKSIWTKMNNLLNLSNGCWCWRREKLKLYSAESFPFSNWTNWNFYEQSTCQVETIRQWHSKKKQRECQLYNEARFNWSHNKSRGKALYRSITALGENTRHNATHCEQNSPLVKHR